MSAPSVATIKRLFAVSSNLCAFPQCSQALVHGDKVTGRICHIKAASPDGPRYDPHQSDTERHGFNNLLLMCPIHHDVIDSDVVSYTVERLNMMKIEHETVSAITPDISETLANQIILNSGNLKIDSGSFVITHNQSGGQAAHIINNYGLPRRTISPETRVNMLAFLASYPTGVIGFASTHGDVEAHEYKEQLIALFQEAGWDTRNLHTFMFSGVTKGLVVTIPFKALESGTPQIVIRTLQLTGSPIAANRGDMANECQHYVQVWHAP